MIPASASKRQWSAGGVVLACRRIWCQGFLTAKNFLIHKINAIKMPSEALEEDFMQILLDSLS